MIKKGNSSKKIASLTNTFFYNFKKNYLFFKKNGLTKRFIITNILFRLFLFLFTLAGISLILSLAKGVIGNDFSFVVKSKIYQFFSNFFPVMSNLEGYQIFVLLFVIVFSLSLIKNFVKYYGEVYFAKRKLKIATLSNEYVFNNYLRLGRAFFDRTVSSSESYFFTRFSIVVKQFLDNLDSFIDATVQIVGLFLLMVFISFKLSVFVLIIVPPFILLNLYLKRKLKSLAREELNGETEFPAAIGNSFARLPLAFILNKQDKERKIFLESCKDFEKRKFEVEKLLALIDPINEVVILSLLLGISFILAFFSYNHLIDVALAFVFFYAFRQLFSAANGLSKIQYSSNNYLRYINKAFKIMDKFEKHVVSEGKETFKGLKEEIRFEKLSFRYPQTSKKVLARVSFVVEKGKTTSIVGLSGSGKSTIASLLLRLYEIPPGKIFFDKKDIRDYTLSSIREKFFLVNQDPILFNDSLYNNIIYGVDRFVSKKQVESLLISLGMQKFVEGLSNGIDTLVAERGINLSGGEKQRISLARALLSNAEVFIFDEPTSSLDSLTEAEISKILSKFTKNKTVIIIAHRLKTIKGSDNVVVIENGSVVESGKIEDLLKLNKVFRKYWDSQSLN